MFFRLILCSIFLCCLESVAIQAGDYLKVAEQIKKGLRDNHENWAPYFEQIRQMPNGSVRDAIFDVILIEFPSFMERYEAYWDARFVIDVESSDGSPVTESVMRGVNSSDPVDPLCLL